MKPAIIRIERCFGRTLGDAFGPGYWRVWKLEPGHTSAGEPTWFGQCRGATTLREAVRQAREAWNRERKRALTE